MRVNKTKLIFVLAVFVVLGVAYVRAVNVGIGTGSPGSNLHIAPPSGNAILQLTNPTESQGWISRYTNRLHIASNDKIQFGTGGQTDADVTIDSVGNVGIGTESPGQKLTVAGTIHSTSGGFKFPDGTTQTTASSGGGGGSSQWVTLGNNVYLFYAPGNVGIGTATPNAKLDVIGITRSMKYEDDDPSYYLDMNVGGRLKSLSIGTSGSITMNEGSYMDLYSTGKPLSINYASGQNTILNWNSGNVLIGQRLGIGTANPRERLEVNGQPIRTDNLQTWSTISDARLKKNILPLNGALAKVSQLKGVSFEWKEPEKHGNKVGQQMGFVAQDVEKIFPQWVSTGSDGYKILSAQGIDALTVEAIKEQQKQIEELKSQNSLLEQRIKKLEMK